MNKAVRKESEQNLNRIKEIDKSYFWHCNICDHKESVNRVQNFDDFGHIKTHLYSHSKDKEVVSCPSILPICDGVIYDKYGSLSNHLNQHIRKNEFGLRNVRQNETSETESIANYDDFSDGNASECTINN